MASSVKNLLFLGLAALLASLVAGWTITRNDEEEEQPPPVLEGLTNSRDLLLLTGIMEARGLEYTFNNGEVRAKEWLAARRDLRVREFDPSSDEEREMAGKVEARMQTQSLRIIRKLHSPEWPLAFYLRAELEGNPDYTPPSLASGQFGDFPCDPTGGLMKGQFPNRIAKLSILLLTDKRNLRFGGREALSDLVKSVVGFDEERGDTLVFIVLPPSERWDSVQDWVGAEQGEDALQTPSFDYRAMRNRLEQTQVELNLEVLNGTEIGIELRNSSRTPWHFYDDSLRQGSQDQPRFIELEWQKGGVPTDGFMTCHSNSLLYLPVELSTLQPGEAISRRVKIRSMLPGLGPRPDDPELEFRVRGKVYFDPNLWTYIESETGWHKFMPKQAPREPSDHHL